MPIEIVNGTIVDSSYPKAHVFQLLDYIRAHMFYKPIRFLARREDHHDIPGALRDEQAHRQ